jgi:hypothetical protein
LRWLAALIIVPWLPILIVNLAADPHGLLGPDTLARQTGVDAEYANTRLSKAFIVARIKPQAIAMGTSRVDHGIDVRHPGFSRDFGPAYNLGLDGAHISEILAYLKHARSVAPIRRVVLGLDPRSFGTFTPQAAFDPAILATPGHPRIVARWVKVLEVSLYWDTFIRSLEALQSQELGNWDPETGRRTERIFLLRTQRCGGVREVFLVRESKELRNPSPTGVAISDAPGDELVDNAELVSFRELIRFARDQEIDLRLFISPTHARDMERIRLEGNWSAFEQWKRDLVRILEEESGSGGNGSRSTFPLWDFSGYNSITTEKIPDAADAASRMHFYWELSHYRKVVGDMVLDRSFGYSDASRPVPSDFGVLLTSSNIEQHLQEIRDTGAKYRDANPDQFADLEELLRTHRRHLVNPRCEELY